MNSLVMGVISAMAIVVSVAGMVMFMNSILAGDTLTSTTYDDTLN